MKLKQFITETDFDTEENVHERTAFKCAVLHESYRLLSVDVSRTNEPVQKSIRQAACQKKQVTCSISTAEPD